MSYDYKKEKPEIFSERGQRNFLEIRDRVDGLLLHSGAFTMENAIKGTGGVIWKSMACIDWMVELGELVEIPTSGAGQDRIFVRAQ